jgi:hypothetical protein
MLPKLPSLRTATPIDEKPVLEVEVEVEVGDEFSGMSLVEVLAVEGGVVVAVAVAVIPVAISVCIVI